MTRNVRSVGFVAPALGAALVLSVLACGDRATPSAPSPSEVSGPAAGSGAAPATATSERCSVHVEEVCSPYARDRGSCHIDDTRWARLTYAGACGSADPEWQIVPDPKTAWPGH